jgi:hypothetical protein
LTVDGPVSMTVRFESVVDATSKMSYETEFVVVDDEEARVKGSQFIGLVNAFNAGIEDA